MESSKRWPIPNRRSGRKRSAFSCSLAPTLKPFPDRLHLTYRGGPSSAKLIFNKYQCSVKVAPNMVRVSNGPRKCASQVWGEYKLFYNLCHTLRGPCKASSSSGDGATI